MSEIFMCVTQSGNRQTTAPSSEVPERNEPEVVVRTKTMGMREKKMIYVLFLLRKYSALPNLRMGEFLHML
jgi:hypothetical protein